MVLRDSFRQQTTAVAIQIRTDSAGPANAAPQQTIILRMDSNGHGSNHGTDSLYRWNRRRESEPETRLERRERIFRSSVIAVRDSGKNQHGSYSPFGFRNDTLRLAILEDKLAHDMQRAKLHFPFRVSRPDTIPDLATMPGITSFYPGGFPPIHLYLIQVGDYQGYLLRKMAPSLLFALFLLGITALSFALIFRSLEQQQRLAKLKNDFISNITHELKTPIATVSVALEALNSFQGMDNPEKAKEYLNISQHELQRLSILVDRVLKMSMFEHKAPQLHFEPFDLQRTFRKVLESMGLQFERSKAEVEFRQHGAAFQMEGDQVHLTNVIYNLLDNALKYSPNRPRIDVELGESNGSIRFTVKDYGIGIAREYQEKIFEQFFRVPQQGQQHNTKGHGLGLSYVAEVIQQHQGKIEVESAPGKGSSFTVTLPKTQPRKAKSNA
ncbi:MAG: HAMP domain-containing histidine kinase [Haliscomenobacter sp.]|nr:HAMP domain-containing histidine kinase [Haliscomenobacter sp.]